MISIIIPTLNEEQLIERCIVDLLSKSEEAVEVIVVDAGSNDETCTIIKTFKNVVSVSDSNLKGRKYASLNKGAELAQGEILLFLDADTILPDKYIALIRAKLADSRVSGGAFEMVFDKNTALIHIVRWMNSRRYNITKRCFGDQAIFCTTAAFRAVGGYPDKIVLEAAHFCSRLMKVGKFLLIKKPVITSSRRFIEGGVLRTFLFDLYLLASDALGINVDRSAKKYWENNM